MRRRKVLIVDDEETITFGLARVLYQDNDLYDVLLARTGEIAQQILTENDIDVMITDVRMPGMSGLDLLCWAASERLTTKVLVMTAYDIPGAQETASRFGCLSMVQKPFDVHRMRKMVRAAMDGDGLSGSLASLSPADVVQMLCLSRKTTALRVHHQSGWGMVDIEDGNVIHATWNELVGEAAFYKILGATEGMFTTVPLPPDSPHTISRGWQHLLIDGMRVEDERKAGLRPEDASSGSENIGPPPPPKAASLDKEAQVARLVDIGFAYLRQKQFEQARKAWEVARKLDPTNRTIELNLRKLEQKMT